MNLANALFDHESIKTTNPKAMELKKVADRLITLAKRKDLHAMRLVFAFLRDKQIVRKLFSDIGDRYSAINGGYTRVVKIGLRKGDSAPMAIIELTQKKETEKEKDKEKAKAKDAKKAKAAKEKKEPKEKKEKAEKAPAKKKAAKDAAEETKPKRTRKPKAEEKVEEKIEEKVKEKTEEPA